MQQTLIFNAVDLRYFKLTFLSNSLTLKDQRFTPSGCEDIGIQNSSWWQELDSFPEKTKLGAIILLFNIQYFPFYLKPMFSETFIEKIRTK